jgi:hypothetical protein
MAEHSTANPSLPRGRRGPVAALARRLDRDERRTRRLLIFGLVVAILGTVALSQFHTAPWSIQGTRAEGLQRALAALNQGEPILTGVIPGSDALTRAGGTDDPGLYLVVPWLAHVLGWEDPVNLLRWIALLAFGVLVAIYPWLIRELSGSTFAGIASPFVLLIGLWLLPLADIYWVSTWVVLGLLPIVLLLDRRWPRFGLAALLGLLVLASLASAIRSQAGLPVLVGAFLVLIRRPWPGWHRGGAVALCIVAYLSISTFGMAAARAERDHQLDGRALTGDTGTSHPFWHTAYIGLGYIPNDWDIRYYDGVAYRDVLREDPKAKFLGPAYGRILRDRYFKLVGDDPLFAVKDYGAKFLAALRPAAPALVTLALVAPWLVLLDARKRRWRRDGLFLALAAVITLASPLLATPDSTYLLGWLGVVLLAAMLAGAAILGEWASPAGLGQLVRAPRLILRAPRRVVAGSGLAALVLIVIAVGIVPGIQDSARRWMAKEPPPQVTQPPDATH